MILQQIKIKKITNQLPFNISKTMEKVGEITNNQFCIFLFLLIYENNKKKCNLKKINKIISFCILNLLLDIYNKFLSKT